MTDERRKEQRLAVDLLFTYELADGTTGEGGEPQAREVPQIKDISRGGAKIASEKSLAMGTLLRVAIMPLLVPGIIRLTGKVVWAKQKLPLYYYGIQFIQAEPGSVEILKHYIEKLSVTPAAVVKKLIKDAEGMEEF